MKGARVRGFYRLTRLSYQAIICIDLTFISVIFSHSSTFGSHQNASKIVSKSTFEGISGWISNDTLFQYYPLTNSSLLDTSKSGSLNYSNDGPTLVGNSSDIAQNTTTKLSSRTVLDERKSNSSSEALDLSDSRLIARLASPRSDEGYDTPTEDDWPEEEDDSVEKASSNLSQKKMVRDLTRVLSKGMSGMTDQVKLETLEGLKKKQHQRKIIKDHRAKLFEDLLTAAITSHSETVKKKGGPKKVTKAQEELKPSSLGLSANANVDPELSTDAETVLQHLQGIASAYESQDPDSSGLEGLSEIENQKDEPESSNKEFEQNEPTHKPSSSSDRPIVKGFKKIKAQISQRRKQLDQIKKIFNVDLAFNPKDGTLMGKTSGSKKVTKQGGSRDLNEYTVIDEEKSQKRKSGSKEKDSNKMNELMSYLKENPEILVSVVAELSGEGESPRSAGSLTPIAPLSPMSSYEEDTMPYPENVENSRFDSIETSSLPHRHNLGKYRGILPNEDLYERRRRSERFYHEPILRNTMQPPVKVRMRQPNDEEIYNANVLQRQHYQPDISSTKTAEVLLLESLRERQLLNLARLDQVMAERQQASNQSNVYSPLNSSLPKQYYNRPISRSSDPRPQQYSNLLRLQNDTAKPMSRSEDELVHHYMVMDPQNNNNDSPRPAEVESYPLSRYAINQRSQQASRDPLSHINELDNFISNQLQHARYNSNSNSNSNSNNNNNNNNINNNQSPSLRRFREWTDVSQTETSSTLRSNKANRIPRSDWLPYDLNTGGSSNNLSESRRTSASTNEYQLYNHSKGPVFGNHNGSVQNSQDVPVIRADLPPFQYRDYDGQPTRAHQTSTFVLPTTTSTTTTTTSTTRRPRRSNLDETPQIYKHDAELREIVDEKGHSGQARFKPGTRLSFDSDQSGSGRGVDYFSAYKSNDDDRDIDTEDAVKSQETNSDDTIDETEDNGAIWA